MLAHAAIEVGLGPDMRTPRAHRLRSSPPLSLREAAGSVWLVGSAAGPLAGDRLRLSVEVGAGASLTVRSTAAMVVLGGIDLEDSSFRVEADVGPGATLRWLVEPTVATSGCRHRSTAAIRLAAGATLVWREELVLGRHAEGPGRLTSRLDVERDGRGLLRQELHVGPGAPGWNGPAVVGGAKTTGTVAVVDAALGAITGRPVGPHAALLPLAADGVLVSATAARAADLRHALDAGMEALFATAVA